MTFGEKLKEVRTKHGDSLRGLSEKTGIIFTYIDKIEKNEKPIHKNNFEKIVKAYPLQEQTLTKAYLEEVLPERISKKIGLKIENNFLDDMKNLIKMLDKENQKLAFLYIVERLEFTSMKNGTYDKVKNVLEEVKEKINRS
ncbi:helix-turn-helix domain-containing protein [Fusobacterium necrophorum]|uniref:Helix-turn-helix domain-containing protein n=1 Tax=Fusobacterium necrophorum TaxID=859 RepID=A0AAW6WD45_9FUSO|nr:helix-turn-helix transcriptional regulator [Fusobacterium necrophorum]MDK4481960.1 helix-turn-helix domain-containing protein [Fusobacterium necrophorum]MDK4512570.1 helix-turn-helix domain-containing protein [Fusobacterium necrophorum]